MKRVIYKGLLALTIAFGVTSCDKNEMDTDVQLTAADVKDNNFIHKVSFGETGLFAAPKGQNDPASKNAADFANSHVYASTLQNLVVTNVLGGGSSYSGTYTAGDISSLNPSDIILGNGDYQARSTNDSSADLSVVTGFASYSSMADFNLSESGSIALAVTHDRGFVIANSEDAIEGSRINSVILSQPAVGDVAAKSGNLILDESDGFNDFYGYLVDGTYNVVINYTLNDDDATAEGTVVIANGVASTLAPILDADDVEPEVTYETTTSTESSTEAELDAAALALYSNNDEDLLDSISRVVSSTITTTGGVPGDAVPSYGDWSIVVDTNHRDEETTISGREDGLDRPRSFNDDNGSGVIDAGDDTYDTIERDIITRYITIDGGTESAGTVISESPWRILEDLHSATPSEETGLGQFVPRTYSAWAPLTAGTDVATIDQTRTHTNAGGSFDPAIAIEALERNIANPDYLTDVTDIFVYTDFAGEASNIPASRIVSGTSGSLDEVVGDDVEFFTRTITTPRENVVDAYSYIQTRTVSVQVNVREDDPALLITDAPLALTQTVEVAESRTDAADDVQTEEVLNPNYQMSVDATDPSGTVNVTGLSVLGQSLTTITVVAPDGGSASVDGLVITFEGAGQYTVSFTGNALVPDFDVTFTVSGDATGSTFTLPASSESDVAFGNN